METLILTVAGGSGTGVVIPRRVALRLSPGEGRLGFPPSPPTDQVWRGSVSAAWEAALRLAGRSDVDGAIEIVGGAPMTGVSAGLPFGLLALRALLDEPLPPHFATGGVLGPDGMLAGGMATAQKARAAAAYGPQLGMTGALFLSPPIHEVPDVPGMPVRLATDVATAFARLAPDAYARRLRDRHRALLSAKGAPGTERLDVEQPFAVVHAPPAFPSLPRRIGGVQVAVVSRPGMGPGAWVVLGAEGIFAWRVPLQDAGALETEIPRLWGLARAGSLLGP